MNIVHTNVVAHSFIHMSERGEKGLKKKNSHMVKKIRAQDDDWERSLSPNRYFTFNTSP